MLIPSPLSALRSRPFEIKIKGNIRLGKEVWNELAYRDAPLAVAAVESINVTP